jgi:Uma2 family endonuclease
MLQTSAIRLPVNLQVTQAQFKAIVAANRDLKLEKTAKGEILVMSPTGGNTGRRNFNLAGQLYLWNQRYQLGVAFDSSTAFCLPNGATRSPDVAWINQEKWHSLTTAEKDDFLPLCPDFVIELRSKTDSLKTLQEKMQEYLENGLKLGWLINPQEQQVEIYRPNQAIEIVQLPTILSGEKVLPEFILDISLF